MAANSAAKQMKCANCLGFGWVCEDHQDRPSALVIEGGCDCGAEAAPCRCNPAAEFEFAEVFASVDDAPWRILSS